MIVRARRSRSAPVVCVVALGLVLASVACTGGSGEAAAPPSTSSPATSGAGERGGSTATTAPYPVWSIRETDDGLAIESGAYDLQVQTSDGLGLRLTSSDVPGVIVSWDGAVVRSGDQDLAVSAVTDTVLGVDHLTLLGQFGSTDGVTGRIELAADGADALAVRVTLDPPTDEGAPVRAWGTDLSLQNGEQITMLGPIRGGDEVGDADGAGMLGRRVEVPAPRAGDGTEVGYTSTAGYRLEVIPTAAGVFDLGADDPGILSVRFDTTPDTASSTYRIILV